MSFAERQQSIGEVSCDDSRRSGQVRQLIDQETAVKEAQLAMLIRVRNVLTSEQRAMLRVLRRDD